MSWAIIPEFRLPDEPEALSYIAAVEAADGQELEPAVKLAYNTFIKGCKADGIWDAIKSSCILAGARTLEGALVPLVGPAPTNVGGLFVAGDYNRETGLAGDGSTKYLDSNRAADAQPQNNIHVAAYATNVGTSGYALGIGGTATNGINLGLPTAVWRLNSTPYQPSGSVNAGLTGISRSSSAEFIVRRNGANETAVIASVAPPSSSLLVFGRTTAALTDARLAFYSIGESLDLALLDTRVTALVNALAAAIP